MASIQKRTRKDGSISYRVEIRLKGHPHERATFTRLTDAKKWTQDTESAIRSGRYFKTRESQRHTLTELIDIYIDEVLPHKKDGKKTEAQLKWWQSNLGYFVLSDVTQGRITEAKKKLASGNISGGKKRSTSTVNRYFAALSTCLTYAVNDLGWLEESPARKVKKGKEPRGRIRFLSEDETIDGVVIEGELTRLLKTCKASSNTYLYTVVVLALSTGMRKSEIMNLTWETVDFKQERITILDTKNDEIRVVPISGLALETLKEHAKVRNLHTPLLFPGKVQRNKPMDLSAPWRAARKRSGIEDFRFHDLRHSAASYLAMSGASLNEIANILGHKTLAMVMRYAHLSEAHTSTVISKLDQRIFGNEN